MMSKSTAENKKLTIVIPVYNRAGIVVRTLDSIATQDGIEYVTLVIVDDGSTDNTLDVVLDWKSTGAGGNLDDVRVISNVANLGAAASRQNGLDLVTTGWVMFFDSDDVLVQGRVTAIISEIDHGGSEIIGWDVRQILSSGKCQIGRFSVERPMFNHLIHGSLATLRYAVATGLVRRAGGWNSSVRGWDDYELGVRLLLMARGIVKLPGIGATIYFTENSITGRSFSVDPDKWEHSLDLCEQSLKNAGIDPVWIDVRRIILAAEYRREGAYAEARRLRTLVLSGKKRGRRIVLNLLYLKHCLYSRGTGRMATLFFSRG